MSFLSYISGIPCLKLKKQTQSPAFGRKSEIVQNKAKFKRNGGSLPLMPRDCRGPPGLAMTVSTAPPKGQAQGMPGGKLKKQTQSQRSPRARR